MRAVFSTGLALCLAYSAASPPGGEGEQTGGNATAKWFLVPRDDLGGLEAFEYALLRINEMRQECEGFHLAPLQLQNYHASEVYIQKHDFYSAYRLVLEPVNSMAPTSIKVRVGRQHSVTDLSLFEVTSVDPAPCDLFSSADDAELLVDWKSSVARHAQEAAMQVLNRQRSILCPQRPELQLQRLVSSSLQPVEGKVVRLVLELREASQSFQSASFTDIVAVSYTLDQDVPGECTVSPEIYSARAPCDMRFVAAQQDVTGTRSSSGRRRLGDAEEGYESLHAVRARARGAHAGSLPGRRLSAALKDAAPADADVIRPFVDEGLDIPDSFDPRLKKTLCFPRGFSRKQGSCGTSSAFAATAVAALRECVYLLEQGEDDQGLRFFSAQELASCQGHRGCSGGDPATAFYYMKEQGLARESCSPYRMRCYSDDSGMSAAAADSQTSQHRSPHYDPTSRACPLNPNPATAACKCLPDVFHFTKPVECGLLPHACPKVRVPHYFKIAGTAEGSTIPLLESHMMQELLSNGPVYVSLLLYEDFYDPVSWTESGIYVHKRGGLIGKHAVVCVGWGTDETNRNYWLHLNSFGNQWQQEGYFKTLRGETSLQMAKFGAWAADWSAPGKDRAKPVIADVELSFSPVMREFKDTMQEDALGKVWLLVAAFTNEPARVLMRVQGLSNTVTGQVKDETFLLDHVLQIDLLKIGLLDDKAKVQLWAVDHAQNTASWGPYTLDIPSERTFKLSQLTVRRLSGEGVGRDMPADSLQV